MSNFEENLAANLIAGLILLVLGTIAVNVWLARRERKRELQFETSAEREAQRKRRFAALAAVKNELEFNQEQTDDLLGSNSDALLSPVLYNVSCWDLVNQESVFTTLEARTVENLAVIYSGLRHLNEVNRLAVEHQYGPTVTLVEFTLRQRDALDRHRLAFEQKQADYVQQLRDQVRRMLYSDEYPKGVFNEALKQIDDEMKRDSDLTPLSAMAAAGS